MILRQSSIGMGSLVWPSLRAECIGSLVRQRRRGHDALVRQLIRVGNNLNQQTRLLHLLKHRGELPEAEALLATLQEVEALLRSVSRQVGRTDA